MNIGTTMKGLAGVGASRLIDYAQDKIMGGDFIRRPRGISVPHAFQIGALWIVMDAFQLPDIAMGRIEKNIEEGYSVKSRFVFMAPNSIIETIGHTWDSYETISSKIQEKAKLVKTVKEKVEPLRQAGERGTEALLSAESARDVINRTIGSVTGEAPVKHKIDTPLVYQDSERRKYDLEFNLIDEGDPGYDIVMPIRKLEEYSSAQYVYGADVSGAINFPYVFRISTFPSDLIKVKYAVLIAITATYNGPYRYGYPTSANLSLSFTDLEPTSNSTFTQRNPISITFSGKEKMITEKAKSFGKKIKTFSGK